MVNLVKWQCDDNLDLSYKFPRNKWLILKVRLASGEKQSEVKETVYSPKAMIQQLMWRFKYFDDIVKPFHKMKH